MTIQLVIDNKQIPVNHIRFSDGSSNVKVDLPEGIKAVRYISLTVEPTSNMDNSLWEISLVLEALAMAGVKPGHQILNLPYLPHGRADRSFERGNPCPLDIFMHVIQSFDRVLITDPHNEDSVNTYPIVEIKPQEQCFIEVVRGIKSGDILVSPDKGALKKIYRLQEALKVRNIDVSVIVADKKRDVSTGRIIETTLPEVDLNGEICWIVDDLCEFGGSFLPLAEKLKSKGAGIVNLYVTHMIAPKGFSKFKGLIDNLYVYQTVSTYVTMIDIQNFNNGLETK